MFSNDRVKIFFKLKQDADGYPPAGVESMWATPLGRNLFRVENSPFFVRGVSYQDVVRAQLGADGVLWFEAIEEASGHSTLRVVVYKDAPDKWPVQELIRKLQQSIAQLGCTFEGSHLPTLFSIDVPPDVSLGPVTALLERGEQAGLWSYEEAAIAHIH